MPLTAGTKLDSYEILALLGAGGMGEVYRARDLALNREVAIKVLPSFVSRDAVRLSRFEQEARAAAALNHPNILAIFQFGRFEGSPYLVSELLEGSTLRQLLQRGPLPTRKATGYGIQIAHGLAAAHEKGIVHRDLKPDNLFLTNDGHLKILDFGLAKLMLRAPDPSGTAATWTQETDPGTVMGTAGYMSPEQVRGQAVDQRTDIFAFGAILYEMLTGKRAFQRPTPAETMTAILNEDPPAISQTGASAPPALQRVINRCLEKNPEQRFHSASDLAFALDALSDSGASPSVAAQAPSRPTPKRALIWSVALIAAISLAAVAWFEIEDRDAADAPLRIAKYTQLTHGGHAGYVTGTDGGRLYLQDGHISQVSVFGGESEPVAFVTVPDFPILMDVSPDGSTFLVESFKPGPNQPAARPIYTVQVVGNALHYLVDAAAASWSPDGKQVAYSTPGGDIDIINADGTGAHKLTSVGGVASELSWSPDGRTIRFFRDHLKSLWEITSSGSNLHQLLEAWHPAELKCCGMWSPDGKFFAFLGPGPAGPVSQIYALDERRGLFRRTAREPFELTSGPIDWDAAVFSKDGKSIFATGATHAGELMRFDAKSRQFQPFLGGISADLVVFSKDGRYVAYVSYPDDVLWRANQDGSGRIQLTSPPLKPESVAWSPDGAQIAFISPSPQGDQAWIVPSAGGSPQRLLPGDSEQESDPSWSPDGQKMIFARGGLGRKESSIWILDLASHQTTKLAGSDGKFSPRWSPDGEFIKAESPDVTHLYLLNVKTQQWSTLYDKSVFAYSWFTSDSRSLLFLRFGHDEAILRIPVTGGEATMVADLKGFPHTGTLGLWLGLDRTDAPLLLHDTSSSDVYAMTLEEK
jgi:eukaryotic-like serine/threonine-protein kinase